MRNLTIGCLAVALLALLAVPTPLNAQGSELRRYAADHRTFCTPHPGDPPFVPPRPCELATLEPPLPSGNGGLVIYKKSEFVPAGQVNTMFITVSGTGDTHNGARLQLAAKIDGKACSDGGNPVGSAPPGWTTVSRHKNYNAGDFVLGVTPFGGDGGGGAGDLHDNSIHYEWCCPVDFTADGTHTFEVRMASVPDFAEPTLTGIPPVVFMEGTFFYVDGAKIKSTNRCVNHTPEP